jgi:hypothetical protein
MASRLFASTREITGTVAARWWITAAMAAPFQRGPPARRVCSGPHGGAAPLCGSLRAI